MLDSRHFSELGIDLTGPMTADIQAAELIEAAVRQGEGWLSEEGALVTETGAFTGRSPEDRFIVQDRAARQVAWGKANQPLPESAFKNLHARIAAHLAARPHYVFNGFAGADPGLRLPVRVVTELAWHSLFARQLLVRPTEQELAEHQPGFTVLSAPSLKADPARDHTRSEAVIAISFAQRVVLIAGTAYAGEIKKSIFSVLNYLLPKEGVLPMHCSANRGPDGDVALFFGLSGTGKTTLSADRERFLIGDDEHAWSDQGIFNLEGGCYAKCIGLSEEKEPQIYAAIRFGTVLENVVMDPATRRLDYLSDALTENTRAAYPLDYIPGAVVPSVASHPRVILFLTADATGVLPPVLRLNEEEAMYHFLSGYTSKLAGTERGVTEPEPTFSACFGEPFMPRPAEEYAQLLGELIARHRVGVYLVNTGWTGGPYGVGQRIDLAVTRQIVRCALAGDLDRVSVRRHPVFGGSIVEDCPGCESGLLDPKSTWQDKAAYDQAALALARAFQANFAKKFPHAPAHIREAGPRA